VINSSLRGVIEACRDYPDRIGRLFAARHGVEGILQEELVDMDIQAADEVRRLGRTPAAGAIGTCRYKLTPDQAEDFDRIVDVCVAHDIGIFFYIGGNDSMDTAHKVAALAHARGVELVATGVPKTIDNDVGDEAFTLIDHTPGYGSCARYWATLIRDVNEENRGMCPSECVSILQAMGRTAGFIPAAARLADPGREMPLQLYMTESHHTLESLYENVNRMLRERGRCIVVVSEGFDVGSLGEARDGFGHIEYGASRMAVAQVVGNYLNEHGLAARGQATWQVPGVLQRCTSLCASPVDIREAREVARHAVRVALEDGSGWMATILRESDSPYRVRYDKVPLETVAASARHLPAAWITPDGLDVTDDFVRYAQPLIGEAAAGAEMVDGLQRFARLDTTPVEPVLAPYVPVRIRASRDA
jgi:6-phosphofructokinase 1